MKFKCTGICSIDRSRLTDAEFAQAHLTDFPVPHAANNDNAPIPSISASTFIDTYKLPQFLKRIEKTSQA